MSPLWALSLFFGQPHLSLYLSDCFYALSLFWPDFLERTEDMQVIREDTKFKFVKDKSYQSSWMSRKQKWLQKKKKGFKIPHQFKKATFQKHSKQKRRKFKRGENLDKQSFKEVKSAKRRDNKENQTLKRNKC